MIYAMRRNPVLLTIEPIDFYENIARVLIEKQELYKDNRVWSLFESYSDAECLNNMLKFSREYYEHEEIEDLY